jgi:hypothetical protein
MATFKLSGSFPAMENRRAQESAHVADATVPAYTDLTPDQWQRRFLDALRRHGNAAYACTRAGISKARAYQWRRKSATFRRAWKQAKRAAVGRLEAEAWKRATLGYTETLKKTDARGQVSYEQRRRRSDQVLMFLLRANAPEKYGKRSTVEVKDGRLSPTEATAARKLLADPTSRELLCRLAERQAELGRADAPALAAPPEAP